MDNLTKLNIDFTATMVKDMMQGSVNGQVTLLQVFDILLEETKNRVGIDRNTSHLSLHQTGKGLSGRLHICNVWGQ